MTETVDKSSLSVELKLLESAYERSKLRVYQDTFVCQKSILELDLLCKREELLDEVRRNGELQTRGTELQRQVILLKEEARAGKDLLKCAEKTLANERSQGKKKEEEILKTFGAELKRKLDKERQNLEVAKRDMLREVLKWKEKYSSICRQVEQLKDELKDKASQVELSVAKPVDLAPICDVAIQLEERSSRSSENEEHEEPSSFCDAEEQQRKEIPQSLKESMDGFKERKISQMEENAEYVKELQHPGYEDPSDIKVDNCSSAKELVKPSKVYPEREKKMKPRKTQQSTMRKSHKKAKKENDPGKCSSLEEVSNTLREHIMRDTGQIAAENVVESSSSFETIKVTENPEHSEEETKEQGTNGDSEEVLSLLRKGKEKPENVKEKEQIENCQEKKVKQRQRKGKKRHAYQTKEREKVNQHEQPDDFEERENEESLKLKKVEELVLNDKRENSDKSHDCIEKEQDDSKGQKSKRKEEREIPDNTDERDETKNNDNRKKVNPQESADEVDENKDEQIEKSQDLEMQKSERRLQRQVSFHERDEEEMEIAQKQYRKRWVVGEVSVQNGMKYRPKLRGPQKRVINRRDNTMEGNTRGTDILETGKNNNSVNLTSCGNAENTSLTVKPVSSSSAVDGCADLFDTTQALDAGGNKPEMNSTKLGSVPPRSESGDAKSSEAHKKGRKRKPAPMKKLPSKKRKKNSSTADVAGKASLSDMSSILNCTKVKKGLFNTRENSLMVAACAQKSVVNTTVSCLQSMHPRLSTFMKTFIAPKVLRSKSQ